jgi:hypothetical protein
MAIPALENLLTTFLESVMRRVESLKAGCTGIENSTTDFEVGCVSSTLKWSTHLRFIPSSHTRMAGSWKIVPVSNDTASPTITLPVGTWTYTLRKLDQNSFKNEVVGYTAHRVSN